MQPFQCSGSCYLCLICKGDLSPMSSSFVSAYRSGYRLHAFGPYNSDVNLSVEIVLVNLRITLGLKVWKTKNGKPDSSSLLLRFAQRTWQKILVALLGTLDCRGIISVTLAGSTCMHVSQGKILLDSNPSASLGYLCSLRLWDLTGVFRGRSEVIASLEKENLTWCVLGIIRQSRGSSTTPSTTTCKEYPA